MSDHATPAQDELGGAAEPGSQQVAGDPKTGSSGTNAAGDAGANTLAGPSGAGTAQTGTPAAAATGTGATESTGPSQTTVPATATANMGQLQITVPGPSTDSTEPPEMTLAELAAADPNTLLPSNAATARLATGGGLPLPAANPLTRETTGNNNSSSSGHINSTKRPAATENGESTHSAKRQRLAHYRDTVPPPGYGNNPAATSSPSHGPVVTQTPFAPPYQSVFLRQNPDLARALAHVNCSYLTARDAPEPDDRDRAGPRGSHPRGTQSARSQPPAPHPLHEHQLERDTHRQRRLPRPYA
ncbi:hypothetical protein VE04_04883 [Pseudogymnoascus sp. 24MN13]|nr:hypothetical protein VE04_04883 [Pseudogymnoascus sp. 24MN13]